MEPQFKSNKRTQNNWESTKWYTRWNRASIYWLHEQSSRGIDKNLLGVYITVNRSYILYYKYFDSIIIINQLYLLSNGDRKWDLIKWLFAVILLEDIFLGDMQLDIHSTSRKLFLCHLLESIKKPEDGDQAVKNLINKQPFLPKMVLKLYKFLPFKSITPFMPLRALGRFGSPLFVKYFIKKRKCLEFQKLILKQCTDTYIKSFADQEVESMPSTLCSNMDSSQIIQLLTILMT